MAKACKPEHTKKHPSRIQPLGSWTNQLQVEAQVPRMLVTWVYSSRVSHVWYSSTIGRWTAIAQVTSMRGTCGGGKLASLHNPNSAVRVRHHSVLNFIIIVPESGLVRLLSELAVRVICGLAPPGLRRQPWELELYTKPLTESGLGPSALSLLVSVSWPDLCLLAICLANQAWLLYSLPQTWQGRTPTKRKGAS